MQVTQSLILVLLLNVLSLSGQDPFKAWPNTGLVLLENGDLPVIGKVNDKTIFYFNMNEDGWDSVYTHSYGYNRIKINEDGSYQRHFSSLGNRNYLHVDYLTSNHFLFQNYTLRGDSTYRTFHENGSLKTRILFSEHGFGSYEASENGERFNDEFRHANGLHSREFEIDTILFGQEAIASGKIVRCDTSYYELRMKSGRIWERRGRDDDVDFEIHANGDTMIQRRREDKFYINTWLCSDLTVDSTFYEKGAIQIKTLFLDGSRETKSHSPNRGVIHKYIYQGHYGEETEEYYFKTEERDCVVYSYYENDTTHWVYKHLSTDKEIVEKSIFTKSGKIQERITWEDGHMQSVQFDTLLNHLRRVDCGTIGGIVLALDGEFDVVFDSLLTKNGIVEIFEPSELLIRTSDGWTNWLVLQETMTTRLYPSFKNGKESISAEWLQTGNSFEATVEGNFIAWIMLTTDFSVQRLMYKGVEWNEEKGVSHEKLALYFHLQERN